jgi:alcohol dehydrogenase class IV
MGVGLNFEFATSNNIIFGDGSLTRVGEIGATFGRKALIVCGSGSVPVDSMVGLLENEKIEPIIFRVSQEPDIATISAGVAFGDSHHCDFIIGFGGGAVIDSAKAISAMMTNPGEVIDYLEVVGRGKQIKIPPLPMIAVPTTAGTGTEVTRNAVVLSEEHRVKVSMRSPMMIPRIAIIDPELTYSMPPAVTASTGMDALTQCIEPYVSIKSNPLTDGIAIQGIKAASRSLLTAYREGTNRKAREDMAFASLCGGLALANSGLGVVHGFAGVIGGMCEAPHGEICASLLAAGTKYNIKTLKDLPGNEEILKRYLAVSQWLTGNTGASHEEGIDWLKELTKELSIKGLQNIGVSEADFGQIIEMASVSSSMQKNPVFLSRETLQLILVESY